jgi:ubiquinone/menaquinone biosynthesis C-methylase UbiE
MERLPRRGDPSAPARFTGTVSGSHRHPVFARLYPRISRGAEQSGGSEHRRRLLADLEGAVIEVGAGHGLNFAHYPPAVTRVLAVEPEPHLRGLAVEAAARAPVAVEVRDGTAEALPAEDGEFDAAVASLVLCSVPDQQAALGEIFRVLRPGGELRFYEHVVSNRSGAARIQRVLDATIYPRLAGGCHCARDTGGAIREAGFQVQREERIAFKASRIEPAIPHILGAALRP